MKNTNIQRERRIGVLQRMLRVMILACLTTLAPAVAQQWREIPGRLTQIAAGGKSVWGINSAHAVYQYSFGAEKFVREPGALKQIAVGNNEVWGIDVSDHATPYAPGLAAARA